MPTRTTTRALVATTLLTVGTAATATELAPQNAPTTAQLRQDTQPPTPAQQAKAAMDTLGAVTAKPGSTSGSFTGTLDLAAIGQPGGTFPFRGTDRSQMILDGTGRLTVVNSMGQSSLNYLGYRTDTKQYYSISMDAQESTLAYTAGTLTKTKTLTLTDPISQLSSVTTFNETGATTTVRVPPKNAVMMTITSTASDTPGGDVLGELLSSTVIPAANVRTASPEALALRKLAGDFTDSKGHQVHSRIVGNGTYLLTRFTENDTLVFLTYNEEAGLFQQFMVQQDRPGPLYLQGPMSADGSITLADPFAPVDRRPALMISFTKDDTVTVVSSLGSRVNNTITWTPKPATPEKTVKPAKPAR